MACVEVKEEKGKIKKTVKLMAPALGTDKVLCNTSVDGRRRFFIADRALKLTPLGGDLVLQLPEFLLAVPRSIGKVGYLLLCGIDLPKSTLALNSQRNLLVFSPIQKN